MEENINYKKALGIFNQYRNHVQKLVRGVTVKMGEGGVKFHLSTKERMDAALALSLDPDTSIVAIRDAEYLMSDVEDTLFTIGVVRAEIKNILNRAKTDRDIIKYSSTALKDLDTVYGTCCDYYDIVKFKFNTVSQLVESLRSMNSTLRMRLERDINQYWLDKGAAPR